MAFQLGKAWEALGSEPRGQRGLNAAEVAGQYPGGKPGVTTDFQQGLAPAGELFIRDARQGRKGRHLGGLAPADTAMAAALGGLAIGKIAGQRVAETMSAGKKTEHVLNTGQLAALLLLKLLV